MNYQEVALEIIATVDYDLYKECMSELREDNECFLVHDIEVILQREYQKYEV